MSATVVSPSATGALYTRIKAAQINATSTITVTEVEKIVHFVRHAQGFHNVAGEKDYEAYKDEAFEDAHLTPLGVAQCNEVHVSCSASKAASRSDLLVVSPMRRTLATATHCFPTHVQKIPWLAHECLREMSGLHPCDRRRPIDEHAVSYPHVDFALIEDNEDPLYFQSEGRESSVSVTERTHRFFDWLVSRDEKEIVVVTHSAYLHNMFDHILDADPELEGGRSGVFKNCEMKSYRIDLSERLTTIKK